MRDVVGAVEDHEVIVKADTVVIVIAIVRADTADGMLVVKARKAVHQESLHQLSVVASAVDVVLLLHHRSIDIDRMRPATHWLGYRICGLYRCCGEDESIGISPQIQAGAVLHLSINTYCLQISNLSSVGVLDVASFDTASLTRTQFQHAVLVEIS